MEKRGWKLSKRETKRVNSLKPDESKTLCYVDNTPKKVRGNETGIGFFAILALFVAWAQRFLNVIWSLDCHPASEPWFEKVSKVVDEQQEVFFPFPLIIILYDCAKELAWIAHRGRYARHCIHYIKNFPAWDE